MTQHSAPSVLQRKWRKLCTDPVRFFADAKNPVIRTAGLWGMAGRYMASDPKALLDLMLKDGAPLAEALWKLHRPKRRFAARTEFPRDEYARWIARHDTLSEADRAVIRTRIGAMPRRPVFSILMPVHNTHLPLLEEAVASVIAQLYPDWQLCITDDASTDSAVGEFLLQQVAANRRIRMHHREFNGGIVAASNDALAMATGDWVVTLDHDDRLSEHALYHVAEAILARPKTRILYSDHDRLTPAGVRDNPYFKPDWNYELALGQNLANHMTVFRREDVLSAAGFREGFDGSQDWDLLLRLVERVPAEAIHHIPRVLYHWRGTGGSFSQAQSVRAWNAGRRAVQEHFARTGQDAVAIPGANSAGHLGVRWRLPSNPPLASIVIPTRDRVDLLRQCLDGLQRRTDYPKFEIILVDNGSEQPETAAFYDTLRGDRRIRILETPGEFNFSHLCNRGVAAARGEIYVLLNNDVNPINSDWLSEMVSHALRPNVGAVGAKLYYPDGTIQHGGVILGVGGVAGHAHKHLARYADGYQGRARLTQRMPAVTAACLAGRTAIYEQLRGLDKEHLKVAFSDVDFCLRLSEAGYAVIWTPFAELYHLESASRGPGQHDAARDRFMHERAWMLNRWRSHIQRDFQRSGTLSAISGKSWRRALGSRSDLDSNSNSALLGDLYDDESVSIK